MSAESDLVRERVAQAMSNARAVTPDERDHVAEAMQGAPTWDQLPADVVTMVERWEDEAGFRA